MILPIFPSRRSFGILAVLGLGFVFLPQAVQALSPGEPDPVMAVNLWAEATVVAAAIEADGDVLLGGDFWWLDGVAAAGLARRRATGEPDGSFVPAIGMAVQLNLSSGTDAEGALGIPRATLLPLPDGRLWMSAEGFYNSWTVLGPQGAVEVGALASLPVGEPIRTQAEGVAGDAFVVSLYTRPPGRADPTGEIRAVSLTTGATLWSHTRASGVQPRRAWPSGDGRWWVAGDDLAAPIGTLRGVPGTAKQLWRLGGDGTADDTLMPLSFERGFTHLFQPLPAGRIAVLATDYRSLQYAGATSTTLPVVTDFLSALGATDFSFTRLHRTAHLLAVQATPAGRLLTNLNTIPETVRSLGGDGTNAPDFQPPPLSRESALVALPDGSFLAGAAKHRPDGTPDPAWQRPTAHRPARVQSLAPALGGAVYVAGTFVLANGQPARLLLRVRADGTVDAAFQPDAQLLGAATQINSLPDGRLYVLEKRVSTFTEAMFPRVVRLLPNGALDPDFTPYEGLETSAVPGVHTRVGEVQEIAVFGDGSLLARTLNNHGNGLSTHAWRGLTSAGVKDASFKPVFNPPFSQPPVLLADGKFWIQGQRYLRDGTKNFTLPAIPSSSTPPCLLSDGRVAFKISGAGVRALLPGGAWDPEFSLPLPSGNFVQLLASDGAGGLLLNYVVPAQSGSTFSRHWPDGRHDPAFRVQPPALRQGPEGVATEVLGSNGTISITSEFRGTILSAFVQAGGLWLGGDFTHCEGLRRDGLVRLSTTVAAGFPAWAAATFRLAPPPTAAQNAEGDPDADGADNALEYATGTDPLAPDADGAQLRLLSHQPLCYAVSRNPDAPEMLPLIEVSDGFTGWREATAAEIVLKGDMRTVTFEVRPGAAARFFRVKFAGPL